MQRQQTGYDKGRLSRQGIVEACTAVVLAKGFATVTVADLTRAAQASGGKLTHHFPTKDSLFEAVFDKLLGDFEAGPLAVLADRARPPQRRVSGFLDAMLKLYARQHELVGCPLGHAAGDSEGVSPAVKTRAQQALQETAGWFEKAFRDLGQSPASARAGAQVFVSAWQGAVVVARSGDGLGHVSRVFRALKRLAPPPARRAARGRSRRGGGP